MNTTQNIQRTIAAALIAASAGLALASCAGQRQPSEPVTDVQVEYRDLAERRANMSFSSGYADQAERRRSIENGDLSSSPYRDLSERRLSMPGGH